MSAAAPAAANAAAAPIAAPLPRRAVTASAKSASSAAASTRYSGISQKSSAMLCPGQRGHERLDRRIDIAQERVPPQPDDKGQRHEGNENADLARREIAHPRDRARRRAKHHTLHHP